MSGAPPGYNASESMLSGGTAPIHAVMGGGGSVPESYNPGVSLLQGGENVPIHNVMGGGAQGGAWPSLPTWSGFTSMFSRNPTAPTTPPSGPASGPATPASGPASAPSGPSPAGPTLWKEWTDDATGNKYYENNDTKEVVWAKPTGNVNIIKGIEPGPVPIPDPSPPPVPNPQETALLIKKAAEIAGGPASVEGSFKPIDDPAKDSLLQMVALRNEVSILRSQATDARLSEAEKKAKLDIAAQKEATYARLAVQIPQIKSPPKPDVETEDISDIKDLVGEDAWIEYYRIDTNKPTVTKPIYADEEANIRQDKSALFKVMMQNYSTSQKKYWWRQKASGDLVSSVQNIVYADRCSRTGSLVGTSALGYHRLVRILPKTTQNIIIIPPINGKLEVLNAAIDTCIKYKYLTIALSGNMALKPDCEIVFSAPIFGILPTDRTAPIDKDILYNNALIWFTILSLKTLNKGSVTALADYQDQTVMAGCMLNRYSIPMDQDPDASNPVNNMLEPSYIVYPYNRSKNIDGILISAAVGSEPSLPNPKSNSLANAAPAGPFYSVTQAISANYKDPFYSINPDPDAADPNINQYLTFRCFQDNGIGNMNIPQIQAPKKGDCDSLYSVLKLQDMDSSKPHYVGPVQMGSPIDGSNVIIILRLLPDKDGLTGFEPSCQALGDGLKTLAMSRLKQFVPSTIRVKPDQMFVQVNLGPNIYDLRVPGLGDNYWIEQQFTESEAAFLNDLNLRPYILDDIFPLPNDTRGWKVWLSIFLKSLTTSACFKDTNLLSKRECENARIFVNAVHNYFFVNDARLAEAFNTEDAALQNTEMFLRESRTRAELDTLRQAQRAQMGEDLVASIDPDIGEKGKGTIIDMGPGEFKEQKLWGDARAFPIKAAAVGPGATGYHTTPLLIVNRKTGEYKLKGLRIIDRNQSTEDLLKERRGILAGLQEKYRGWNFLM